MSPTLPFFRDHVRVRIAFSFLIGLGASLKGGAESVAAPTVAIAIVARQDLYREVQLQAEFRPYQEIDLHAKVAGYLKEIKVDIGDRVKKGDTIATLEVPELTDDFNHAKAVAQRAEADYREAHLNFQRMQAVSKGQPNLLAQQDIDIAEQNDSEAEATKAAASSDMQKYQTMINYTEIKAPFDGIITKRFADPGSLIQAGTSSDTQSRPIIRLSQMDHLRLTVPVSVTYADRIRVGDTVSVRLGADQPSVKAKISRFNHRIAAETRTMETEIDVANEDFRLIPGMYVTVSLRIDPRERALTISVEAISDLKSPTVYLVNEQLEVEERPVQLGLETATRFEVVQGLKEGDRVIVGSRALIQLGEKVRPKEIALATTK